MMMIELSDGGLLQPYSADANVVSWLGVVVTKAIMK